MSCSKVRIITTSHMRETTCAASSTGSPRPSWESLVLRKIAALATAAAGLLVAPARAEELEGPSRLAAPSRVEGPSRVEVPAQAEGPTKAEAPAKVAAPARPKRARKVEAPATPEAATME